MRGPRLEAAFGSESIPLPEEGRIAVIGPRAGDDLSALPRGRTEVVQGSRPDHDAFAAAGYATSPAPAGRYALAIVCLPRSKALARAQIANAARMADRVVVDGEKTDGIDAILRDLRGIAEVGEPVSKAHGKCFEVAGDLSAWAAPDRRRVGDFLVSLGGFSADGPDPASVALAAALPEALGRRVADLGAGWGFLSRAILGRPGVEVLHLVEADRAALDCARANVPDPRARFHWADATRFVPPEPLDTVVMNPPFHHGRAAAPELGRAFIAASAGMLHRGGSLWLVANRHLPYEAALDAAFTSRRDVGGAGPFKIVHAQGPRTARHRAHR